MKDQENALKNLDGKPGVSTEVAFESENLLLFELSKYLRGFLEITIYRYLVIF